MDNFEQHLMQKYPDLFYKNKSGELECPCGAWVPPGWEKTVDDLCGAIIQYTKCTYRSSREIANNAYYFWKACASFINWCHIRFIKVFPKLNKAEYNKPVFSFIEKQKTTPLSQTYRAVWMVSHQLMFHISNDSSTY